MPTYTVTRDRLNETVVRGQRLGRHVNHDSRSRAYPVPRVATLASKSWRWMIPTLDQGELGSCTGNGSTHQMGCDGAVWQALQPLITTGKLILDEATAVKVYERATQIDPYAGTYPPTDTGSDGLSAAKACQGFGWIGGYVHALSTTDVTNGLQTGAGMVGTNWTSNMDNPDPTTGIITKPQSGSVRGGHEYCIYEVDLTRGLYWFRQSWGQWGIQDPDTQMWGRFGMQIEDFAALLKQDGDATFFTPDAVTPTPTPTPPQPGPTPPPAADAALVTAGNAWEKTILSRLTKAGKMRTAFDDWKQAHGY